MLTEQLGVLGVAQELVVGRATDHAAAQLRDRLLVEHAAEGVRGEHVARLGVGGGRVEHVGADLGGEPLRALAPHVGHADARARGRAGARDTAADLADAHDHHPATLERLVTERHLQRGAHAEHDRLGGERRGVPAPTALRRGAHDVARELGERVQVCRRRADVGRRDVAAREVVDRACVRGELLRRAVGGAADDRRLAAAEVEAGHRRLRGHRQREAEHVAQGRLGVLVRVPARAAQRRAEGGRVDRDDRAQPGRGIVVVQHLFVVERVVGLGDGRAAAPVQQLHVGPAHEAALRLAGRAKQSSQGGQVGLEY